MSSKQIVGASSWVLLSAVTLMSNCSYDLFAVADGSYRAYEFAATTKGAAENSIAGIGGRDRVVVVFSEEEAEDDAPKANPRFRGDGDDSEDD